VLKKVGNQRVFIVNSYYSLSGEYMVLYSSHGSNGEIDTKGQLMKTHRRIAVYLRPPEVGDRSRFIDAVKQSVSLHRPMVAPPCDTKAYREHLKRIHSDQCAGFLVCRKSDDALVGVININEIVRSSFQSGYLGYYAFVPYQQQGYMTQGLKLVLRQAFNAMKLHRLEANIQPGNTPSIALVRRCGFKKEGFSPRYLKVQGRWRDHERWALVKEYLE
jgi:[ribosomal protein S5]-alanine N-acetyltransferase